jgi:hypothetical protein
MDFDQYTAALETGLKPDVQLDGWSPSNGNLRTSTGTVNSLPLVAYVWQLAEGKYWRIMYIDITGKGGAGFPDTDLVDTISATF